MIIIANIGNSNLHYQGKKLIDAFSEKTHPQFWTESGMFDFRACTKEIRDNSHYEPELSEEIISQLMPADDTPTWVYLIATDQPDAAHRYSDTIHEGEILTLLLPNRHPNVERVSTIVFDRVPVKEVDIYQHLWPELRELLAGLPKERTVRFSEAGGTPQLKAAVKEALRYYLAPERFDAHYTPFKGAAYSTANEYHDRYVQLRVAKRFVEAYDYAGALRALADVEISEALMAGLLVAQARKNFDLETAQAQASLYVAFDPDTALSDYLTARMPDAAVPFAADLHQVDRRHIFELAALFELHLRQKDYALAIAVYYRLCEQIGQSFRKKLALNVKEELAKPAIQNKVKELTHLPLVDEKKSPGVPALLGVAYARGGAGMRRLVKLIAPTINILNGHHTRGLNTIRNQSFFAHQAEAVTFGRIEDPKKGCPGFIGPNGRAHQILTVLGIPIGHDSVYDQMNAELLHLFQQE